MQLTAGYDFSLQCRIIDNCEWCAVPTRGTAEMSVLARLTEKDIACFLPLIRKRCSYRGTVQTISKPLYPNYLFAGFSNEWERHDIRRTSDVCGELLLTKHKRAQEKLVEEIQSLQIVLAENPFLEKTDQFAEGRLVKVVGGPYENVVGRIIRRRRKVSDGVVTKDVLQIGVEMMGSFVQLDVDRLDAESIQEVGE